MKNLIVFFLLVTLSSCNNDDTSPNPTPVNELDGTWKLQAIHPGYGTPYNYTDEIQWTFDTTANTITVTIAPGTNVNNSMPFKTTGTYNYTITASNIYHLMMWSLQPILNIR